MRLLMHFHSMYAFESHKVEFPHKTLLDYIISENTNTKGVNNKYTNLYKEETECLILRLWDEPTLTKNFKTL